jgi:glycosyltransferase involved in cell wall biosynthesis
MQSYRLAFVYPSFTQHGGAETHLLNAMRGLAERGQDVHLFTAAYDEHNFSPEQPFTIHSIGGRGFLEGAAGTCRNIVKLSRLLRGYDLVVAGSFPANVWAAMGWHGAPVTWLCMEPKRNLYPGIMYAEAPGIQPHGYRTTKDYRNGKGLRLILHDLHVLLPYSWRAAAQRTLDRQAVQRCAHIIANSPYIAEKIRQIYGRPDADVGWAGIPLPALDNEISEQIIFVPTRLERIKNVEPLLHAVRLLLGGDRLNGFRVVIAGTGSDENRLRALAATLALDNVLEFAGYMTDAERDGWYARCAFVIYPSLAEPLGLPCAEAALASKPVIASHQGGPAAVVDHERTGLLVDTTKPEAIANAIARLIEKPHEAQAMGKAARVKITPLMGLTDWIVQFEALLRGYIEYRDV